MLRIIAYSFGSGYRARQLPVLDCSGVTIEVGEIQVLEALTPIRK
jgi:hypothetical protein